ncbi:MAG: hypothetical protein ACOCWH_05430, partial [Spirochaetota bacterium]
CSCAFSALFSESHSRFIVTVRNENASAFESIMEDRAFHLGTVSGDGQFTILYSGREVISAPVASLCASWKKRLEIME